MENNGTEETVSKSDVSANWTEAELDNFSVRKKRYPQRRTIGLSEEELPKAAVVFGIIIVSFAGLGLWLSSYFPEKQPPEFMSCAHIAGNAERLSCYDKAATTAATPFKGASPFSSYSRSDLTNS